MCQGKKSCSDPGKSWKELFPVERLLTALPLVLVSSAMFPFLKKTAILYKKILS
jgi:hypothetical protein